MTKHDWKPGDVALIEVGCHANRFVGMFTHRGWRYGPDKWVADDPAIVTARPLVVIDPEDREQVERLVALYVDFSLGHYVNDMQAALREFANPKPPKPAEPTGLGAVVEGYAYTDTLRPFVRCASKHRPWTDAARVGHAWHEIDAVTVLSEGVKP